MDPCQPDATRISPGSPVRAALPTSYQDTPKTTVATPEYSSPAAGESGMSEKQPKLQDGPGDFNVSI